MYFSKIPLDNRRRETISAINSPCKFHGAVESCFSGERTRTLWRLDSINGVYTLLLLSSEKPDLTGLQRQFSSSELLPFCMTKAYEPLLERISDGMLLRFRLTANPVRSSPSEKDSTGKRGKLFAHVTVSQQKDWLMSRSLSNGFELTENCFDVVESRWLSFKKQGNINVSLHSVTFEGTLRVADAALLKNALINGIGREKAYGCGLLTVIRISSPNRAE